MEWGWEGGGGVGGSGGGGDGGLLTPTALSAHVPMLLQSDSCPSYAMKC